MDLFVCRTNDGFPDFETRRQKPEYVLEVVQLFDPIQLPNTILICTVHELTIPDAQCFPLASDAEAEIEP
jgi:hypothetical protein